LSVVSLSITHSTDLIQGIAHAYSPSSLNLTLNPVGCWDYIHSVWIN